MAERGRVAVVPCSREKAWDDDPGRGPTCAADAYTSPLHHLCRRFAEARVGGRYLVLSALYGLLAPDDIVAETYDVTFDRPDDPVVSAATLTRQLSALDADALILLLPREYADRLKQAGARLPLRFEEPLGPAADDLEAMAEWLRQACPG